MVPDKLMGKPRIPAHRVGKEDRIYSLHKEANMAVHADPLAIRGVQEADVLIIGSAALRIPRENACKVACARS